MCFAPGLEAAEAELYLGFVALDGEVDGPGAQWDQVCAVVLLAEPVLQTVFPITVGAVYSCVAHGVD